MNQMVLSDSRRLTGPNLISDGPGAILDVRVSDELKPRVLLLWREKARAMLDEIGWTGQRLDTRVFPGGANLVLGAPVDALYAATEVNEWAWSAAIATIHGEEPPSLTESAIGLKSLIADERNPTLIALQSEASRAGLAFLSDDDFASVGLGKGSQTWPVASLPSPDRVDWKHIHDIPAAVITGTNGKSTTVRLLSAIAREAGMVQGVCSTDWIRVGDETIDHGDYSGPGGARTLLRNTDVDIAFLETARGGILRRGLGVPKAQAALVTNVAEDHLGEYGVNDLMALAQTKLVVGKAVMHGGCLVLNADDHLLATLGPGIGAAKWWFSLDARNPQLKTHLAAGGDGSFCNDGILYAVRHGERHTLLPVDTVPITVAGAAKHNTSNALAAIGVAFSLGIQTDAIRAGLASFKNTPSSNPGRGNLFEIGGVQMMVDFAHNPHGVTALVEMITAMPAKRRLIVLGQAGDRDDESIRGLARNAWAARPDRIIIKELKDHLRGRSAGEVPALMEDELLKSGAPKARIEHVDSEMQALQAAIAWSRAGDLLLLLMHSDRERVFQYLEKLRTSGWRPGQA